MEGGHQGRKTLNEKKKIRAKKIRPKNISGPEKERRHDHTKAKAKVHRSGRLS